MSEHKVSGLGIYRDLLGDIKIRVHAAQGRAALSANVESGRVVKIVSSSGNVSFGRYDTVNLVYLRERRDSHTPRHHGLAAGTTDGLSITKIFTEIAGASVPTAHFILVAH